jgi:hypothetical protein
MMQTRDIFLEINSTLGLLFVLLISILLYLCWLTDIHSQQSGICRLVLVMHESARYIWGRGIFDFSVQFVLGDGGC